MNNIKSYGTCTKNINGNFEIHWDVESNWFKKLFNIQTEFKYECSYEDGQKVKGNPFGAFCVDWYDTEGRRLGSSSTRQHIHDLLLLISYSGI